jgi:hypothetical protein
MCVRRRGKMIEKVNMQEHFVNTLEHQGCEEILMLMIT